MSVGKDSILRAANAEAKNTETKAEPVKPAEEVKAPAEVKEAPKAEVLHLPEQNPVLLPVFCP